MGADFTISVIEIKKGDELAYKERVISGILEITEGWLKENASSTEQRVVEWEPREQTCNR